MPKKSKPKKSQAKLPIEAKAPPVGLPSSAKAPAISPSVSLQAQPGPAVEEKKGADLKKAARCLQTASEQYAAIQNDMGNVEIVGKLLKDLEWAASIYDKGQEEILGCYFYKAEFYSFCKEHGKAEIELKKSEAWLKQHRNEEVWANHCCKFFSLYRTMADESSSKSKQRQYLDLAKQYAQKAKAYFKEKKDNPMFVSFYDYYEAMVESFSCREDAMRNHFSLPSVIRLANAYLCAAIKNPNGSSVYEYKAVLELSQKYSLRAEYTTYCQFQLAYQSFCMVGRSDRKLEQAIEVLGKIIERHPHIACVYILQSILMLALLPNAMSHRINEEAMKSQINTIGFAIGLGQEMFMKYPDVTMEIQGVLKEDLPFNSWIDLLNETINQTIQNLQENNGAQYISLIEPMKISKEKECDLYIQSAYHSKDWGKKHFSLNSAKCIAQDEKMEQKIIDHCNYHLVRLYFTGRDVTGKELKKLLELLNELKRCQPDFYQSYLLLAYCEIFAFNGSEGHEKNLKKIEKMQELIKESAKKFQAHEGLHVSLDLSKEYRIEEIWIAITKKSLEIVFQLPKGEDSLLFGNALLEMLVATLGVFSQSNPACQKILEQMNKKSLSLEQQLMSIENQMRPLEENKKHAAREKGEIKTEKDYKKNLETLRKHLNQLEMQHDLKTMNWQLKVWYHQTARGYYQDGVRNIDCLLSEVTEAEQIKYLQEALQFSKKLQEEHGLPGLQGYYQALGQSFSIKIALAEKKDSVTPIELLDACIELAYASDPPTDVLLDGIISQYRSNGSLKNYTSFCCFEVGRRLGHLDLMTGLSYINFVIEAYPNLSQAYLVKAILILKNFLENKNKMTDEEINKRIDEISTLICVSKETEQKFPNQTISLNNKRQINGLGDFAKEFDETLFGFLNNKKEGDEKYTIPLEKLLMDARRTKEQFEGRRKLDVLIKVSDQEKEPQKKQHYLLQARELAIKLNKKDCQKHCVYHLVWLSILDQRLVFIQGRGSLRESVEIMKKSVEDLVVLAPNCYQTYFLLVISELYQLRIDKDGRADIFDRIESGLSKALRCGEKTEKMSVGDSHDFEDGDAILILLEFFNWALIILEQQKDFKHAIQTIDLVKQYFWEQHENLKINELLSEIHGKRSKLQEQEQERQKKLEEQKHAKEEQDKKAKEEADARSAELDKALQGASIEAEKFLKEMSKEHGVFEQEHIEAKKVLEDLGRVEEKFISRRNNQLQGLKNNAGQLLEKAQKLLEKTNDIKPADRGHIVNGLGEREADLKQMQEKANKMRAKKEEWLKQYQYIESRKKQDEQGRESKKEAASAKQKPAPVQGGKKKEKEKQKAKKIKEIQKKKSERQERRDKLAALEKQKQAQKEQEQKEMEQKKQAEEKKQEEEKQEKIRAVFAEIVPGRIGDFLDQFEEVLEEEKQAKEKKEQEEKQAMERKQEELFPVSQEGAKAPAEAVPLPQEEGRMGLAYGSGSRAYKSALCISALLKNRPDRLAQFKKIEAVDLDLTGQGEAMLNSKGYQFLAKNGILDCQKIQLEWKNFGSFAAQCPVGQGAPIPVDVTLQDKKAQKTKSEKTDLVPLASIKYTSSAVPALGSAYSFYCPERKRYWNIYAPQGILGLAVDLGEYDFNLPDPDAGHYATKIFSRMFGFILKMENNGDVILSPGPNAQKILDPEAKWAHYYFGRIFTDEKSLQNTVYEDLAQLSKKKLGTHGHLRPVFKALFSVLLLKKFIREEAVQKAFAAHAEADGSAIIGLCKKKGLSQKIENCVDILVAEYLKQEKQKPVKMRRAVQTLVHNAGYLEGKLSERGKAYWVERASKKTVLEGKPIHKKDVTIKHIAQALYEAAELSGAALQDIKQDIYMFCQALIGPHGQHHRVSAQSLADTLLDLYRAKLKDLPIEKVMEEASIYCNVALGKQIYSGPEHDEEEESSDTASTASTMSTPPPSPYFAYTSMQPQFSWGPVMHAPPLVYAYPSLPLPLPSTSVDGQEEFEVGEGRRESPISPQSPWPKRVVPRLAHSRYALLPTDGRQSAPPILMGQGPSSAMEIFARNKNENRK